MDIGKGALLSIKRAVVTMESARYFNALNTCGAILLQNLNILESFLKFSFSVVSSLPICHGFLEKCPMLLDSEIAV
jgi:hypothetical protein